MSNCTANGVFICIYWKNGIFFLCWAIKRMLFKAQIDIRDDLAN